MPDNGTRARKSKSYTSRSKLIPQSKMNNLALDIPGIISRNTAWKKALQTKPRQTLQYSRIVIVKTK